MFCGCIEKIECTVDVLWMHFECIVDVLWLYCDRIKSQLVVEAVRRMQSLEAGQLVP